MSRTYNKSEMIDLIVERLADLSLRDIARLWNTYIKGEWDKRVRVEGKTLKEVVRLKLPPSIDD